MTVKLLNGVIADTAVSDIDEVRVSVPDLNALGRLTYGPLRFSPIVTGELGVMHPVIGDKATVAIDTEGSDKIIGWIPSPERIEATEGGSVNLDTNVFRTHLGYYSLKDEGLLLDGSDESAEFAAVLVAANADGREIVHTGGNLGLGSKIVQALANPANGFRLRGNGPDVSKITQLAGSSTEAMIDLGLYSSLYTNPQNLTANAVQGSRTIVVANAAGYAIGDTLMLSCTELWPYSDKGAVRGELVKVASKVGNTITTQEPIDDTYTTATTATVRKVLVSNSALIEGLSFHNDDPGTHSEGFLRLGGFLRVTINDVNMYGGDSFGMALQDCDDFDIDNIRFYDFNDNAAAGRYCYGVEARGASRNGRVTNIHARGAVRHAFTTTSDSSIRGIPRHITVAHGTATGMTNTCWDTHPEGEQIHFQDLHAHQTKAWGFAMRAPNSDLSDCTCDENVGAALWVRGGGARVNGFRSRRARAGNIVSVATDVAPGPAYDGQGIRVADGPVVSVDIVNLTDVWVEDSDHDCAYIGHSSDGVSWNKPVFMRPGRSGSAPNGMRYAGTSTRHRINHPRFDNCPIGVFGVDTVTDFVMKDPELYTVGTLIGGSWSPAIKGTDGPQDYFGNATPTEYTGESNIPFQIAVYFGNVGGQPLTGRPQAWRALAKFFGPTTTDSMQAGSSQVVAVDTGTPFTQTLPATGNESNVLFQGGNRLQGKAVAHSFSIEAHQTARVDEPRLIYAKEVGARDVGTRVDDWVFMSVGDPASGSLGSIVDRTAFRTKIGVHLEDYLVFGSLTTTKPKGYLVSQALLNTNTITLEAGQVAAGALVAGNTLMIGTGALAESRTIQSVAGDVITLTANLGKTHPALSAVYVHGAAGLGNLYMLAGRLKTDVNLEPPGINAGQYQVRFSTNGFFETPDQVVSGTPTDPAAPSAGNSRLFGHRTASSKSAWATRFNTGPVVLLAVQGGEALSVASATTVTLPTPHTQVQVFNITGTTPINAITTTDEANTIAILKFVTGAANMVIDQGAGGNLILNGNLSPDANDVLVVANDGTNWVELSRSPN